MVMMITELEELENQMLDWKDLYEYCDIFTFKEWLISWWKCHGRGSDKKLRLYLNLDHNNKIVTVFPLMLLNERGKTILSQLCDSCSDYFKVICNSNGLMYVKEIIEYIDKNEEYDEFYIRNLRADDINTRLLVEAMLLSGHEVSVGIQGHNYFIDTRGTYEKYFSGRSKNFRRKIRKTEKLTADLSFEVFDELSSDLFNEIILLHTKRWKSGMQVSAFNDPRRIQFVALICKEYAKRGYLRIFTLKKDDALVAYRLGFVFDNQYYDWNTSYNIEYGYQSVGILLCNYVVKYCFQNDIGEFNFLRGEEFYKKEFATSNRELLYLKSPCNIYSKNHDDLPPKSRIAKIMDDIKGYIFDLDGVVYSGTKPIDETIEFINFLLEKKIKVGFLTNTSSRDEESIRTKLYEFGIENGNYFIETSAMATAAYLHEKKIKSCFVYGGEQVLASEISKRDIQVFTELKKEKNMEALVVGYSQQYNYEDLEYMSDLLSENTLLIGTDEDKKFSHNGKCLPGTAWILASIESVNNRKAFVVGKPNSYSAYDLLQKMNLTSEDILVIGDNLQSDIQMAKKINAKSCLLFGGVSKESDIAKLSKNDRPDIVLDDLRELKPYII